MAQKTITVYPASYDSENYAYNSVNSSYPLSNPIGKGSSNGTYAQWNLLTGSRAESYVFYNFDLSDIPDSATIDSVDCTAKAYISSTNSNRIRTRQIQMYYGTSTPKGSASTVSTSTSAITLSCGTWTREELNDCRIRIYSKRGTYSTTTTYYNRFYGATLTISYTYNGVKYTITASCTDGGTISPNGSISVESENDLVFNIAPNNGYDLDTIIVNGIDVTSDAVKKYTTAGTYTVNQISSAEYGFELNSNDYYESTNQGQSSSASVCRVNFSLPVSATITFYVINYAESNYDYGILGNIDTELSTDYTADSDYMWSGRSSHSNSEQSVVYTMDAGEHFIDVKYRKDSFFDSNNDSLQFRIEIELLESVDLDSWYYEYSLLNIQADSEILVTFKKIAILLLNENSTWITVTAVYKKENGIWVEQTDLEKTFDVNTRYIKR